MIIRPFLFLLAYTLSGVFCASAQASPWAGVGNSQLRSDIEFLESEGMIDGITSHWPLPWQSILADIGGAGLEGRSASAQLAAGRILTLAQDETLPGISASFLFDVTNRPSLVYGFGSMGRGDGQAQLSLAYSDSVFSGRISLGTITRNFGRNSAKLMPDGTYLSADLGDVRIYAGYLDHWWGPGHISALSLSNNARPMPQFGIQRSGTAASGWPVLRWLGSWQVEFLLGYLDGPRIQSDTYYNALRFTFNPAPGLEIGLSRTEMFCGQGHSCVPLRDYFDLRNDAASVNRTNDQGAFDIKYASQIGGVPLQVYIQVMNEDSSPFVDSGSSHLFGASVFLPVSSNPLKLTLEYADSIATRDIFSFGDNQYGFSYTNGTYPDGMRYRGRTLGFSLDSDSTLLSLQGSWTDAASRFYELSLHHARIGTSHAPGANVLSTAPMRLNMAEARVTLPWNGLKLDIAGRLQDDQPRPSHGFVAAIEVALRMEL